ncbi:MAG: class I SAM-dependent methyltransferase [Planctomycetaceae bacterium]|nr:class I SAM-dependent methyltransferase [Planctomycetaceae bacterium]
MTHESESIRREAAVQGAAWQSMHGGYFADAAIAAPLVAAIAQAARHHPPAVLADLGGGTGFVLEQALAQRCLDGAALINVDLSPRQLEQSRHRRIVQLYRSADAVTRDDLGAGSGRLMLVMRSLLHYFGRQGLRPFLQHVRSQIRTGEILVHQSACFVAARDAECLNDLYRRMRTEKWYPTLDALREALEQTRWQVLDVQAAPPLPLTGADLARRYQLTAGDVETIGRELTDRFGHMDGVFEPGPTPGNNAFTAYLHYHIFTCAARP